MVKRSRLQSHEAPSRRSWRVMVPPEKAFHSQTFSRNCSRFSESCGCRHGLRAFDGKADALLLEIAHHDHLGGDAGMVGAGLPQHVVALHAAPADQHVLQRVVERVAHVQAARDVGRRDDDAVRRLGRFRMRLERAGAFPLRVPAGFDLLGVVGLVEHSEPYSENAPQQKTPRWHRGVRFLRAPGVSGGSAGRSRVRRTARPSAAGCGRATP